MLDQRINKGNAVSFLFLSLSSPLSLLPQNVSPQKSSATAARGSGSQGVR
jgi:hypothetical protein